MSTDDFLARFGSPGASQPDPIAAAQQAMRNPLPARFYKEAGVLERDGLFHVALDGKTARTPARKPLAVTSRPVAEALAVEWQAQAEPLDHHQVELLSRGRLIPAEPDSPQGTEEVKNG